MTRAIDRNHERCGFLLSAWLMWTITTCSARKKIYSKVKKSDMLYNKIYTCVVFVLLQYKNYMSHKEV